MHCSSCGAPVPPAVAAAPFCAFCGVRRVELAASAPAPVAAGGALGGMFVAAVASAAPYAAHSVFAGPGTSATASATPRANARAERPFTASSGDLCMAFDPQIGFVLIGVHAPDEGAASLRAYDVQRERVVWEALAGQRGLDGVEWEQLAVRGRSLFVAPGRSMHVLDLLTGQPRWGAEFSDTLTYDATHGPTRGLTVLDPTPVGQPGAIVTATADYTLCAFQRDTGQPLWRDVRTERPGDATVIPEVGLILFERRYELMNPFFPKPVASLGGGVERCTVVGRYGILQVRHWGWRDREGVALHDFATAKEVFFEALDDVEDSVPGVLHSGRVFCAVEDGAKLVAVPNGKPVELVPGFAIRALLPCGPMLFVLLEKKHGTSYRRVVGVDTASLSVRFDMGELTTEPNDDWTRQMCTDGQLVFLATSPSNNDRECEIWAVDPAGRVRWKAPVGRWTTHYLVAGHLVVASSPGWKILRADDGQVVGKYANEF